MGMKDFFSNLFNTNNNQNASNNTSMSEADMSTEASSHDAFVASLAPENYSGGTFPDTTPASNHGSGDDGGREIGGDGRSDRGDSGRDRGGDEDMETSATETSPEGEDSTDETSSEAEEETGEDAGEDEDSVSIEIEGGDKEGMANQSPCTGKGIDDIIADNDEDDDGPDDDDDGPNGGDDGIE